MDMSGVAVDQYAVYQRRASMKNNNYGGFLHTPRSSVQSSMTFQQQQQLLKLLNAHAPGGASACTGLSFYEAHGNGSGGQIQKQQQVPPQPYSAAPALSPKRAPTRAPLPPRPAYSSLPAPHLARQQSNPPLLPLPFSRSSSLAVPGPVRQQVRNKPVQPSAPRVNVGSKEQQMIRPGRPAARYSAAPSVVMKPKKIEPPVVAPLAKPDDVAKMPNVPVIGSDRKTPAAAAMDIDLYVSEAKVRAAADSKGFSLYSLAPHPSSLPLPRLISLKPKAAVTVAASCNAEAAMVGGVDAFDQSPGITSDYLTRLLRL